ncbi:MAG: carbamoyl transferase [Rhodospirillaceae bacterium]|nr:carbamoyl transferase [Magnetovibrio sp.]MAY67259.1 carbamoyl transferase [Rhodospirillaceae bacterium]
MNIIGLHGGVTTMQHDAAAALICDGKVVACVEEERLSRIKHAYGQIPVKAIAEVLDIGGLTAKDIDLVCHSGIEHKDLPVRVAHYFRHFFGHVPEIRMYNHQDTHLASTFYMSDFDEAMVASFDGFGDWESGAMGLASASGIDVLQRFGHELSLGVFYQTMASYLGFAASGDEYKVMGLAPYGKPGVDISRLIRPTDDGYFVDSAVWDRDPPARSHFENRYGQIVVDVLGEPRRADEPLTQRHMDIAHATQLAFEEVMVHLITKLHEQTGSRNLCLSGGCALNCLANMRIRKLPFIEKMFVQPASTDQGTALGGAIMGALELGASVEPLTSYFLGRAYEEADYLEALELTGMSYTRPDDVAETAATLLAEGKVIAWMQGRSEFGPRALGNRSILADPGRAEMKDEVNKRIKYREGFRPFAPAVLAERAEEVFDMSGPSPHMTVTYPVREAWKDRLPATTHVNGTSRVQTVSKADNPLFYELISRFEKKTGRPAVMNTSFNIKGDAMVETPLNAIATFAGTGLDALILGPFLLQKNK